MRNVWDKALHPFLLASYPVLALLGNNIEEIKAETALRALILSILAAGALYLLLNVLIKNHFKAAVITSLTIILFASYGHVYHFLKTTEVMGFSPGRHRLLIPVWLGLFMIGLWWLISRAKELQPINRSLNFIAAFLLIYPTLQIGTYNIRAIAAQAEISPEWGTDRPFEAVLNSPSPDIYYVILDAYARDDTLLQYYDLDNQAFLERLKELGFYIARCSQSNYAQTQLSLATSLNYNYLEALGDEFHPGNKTRVKVTELIHHNATRQALERLGYTSIAFESGFKVTQWEDANIYLSPHGNALDEALLLGGINPFEEMLIRTSAGIVLMDGAIRLPKYIQPDFDNPRKIHRERILYVLDQLNRMPEVPGPKFVFAHLVTPHPPYVFGPNGEFTDYDKPDNPGYQDQITFLNKVLIPLFEGIIQDSSSPPIIIVQADHGAIQAPPNQRMNILNAYFLPGDGNSMLYESISPVNSFRVLFNEYFGSDFELLDDTSYFSVYNRPYEFTIIPDLRSGCR